MEQNNFPKCQVCQKGDLIPLSDFGQNAPVTYKAWCCTNPTCGFNVKMQSGTIKMFDPIVKPPTK